MMKKLLAVLGVAMILISFTMNTPAVGEESSSPDPAAKSMQQCDQFPNYGTQIDFEDVATGTIVDVQYLGSGVKFGAAADGPITQATTDAARPLDGNILAGQPIFTGDIHASFWIGDQKACVDSVGATVGWCDNVGAITMKAYNNDGVEVGSYTNTPATSGVQFFSISATRIHKVIFFMGEDPYGADIDCFTYDTVRLCIDGPSLTEWGLIGLMLVLLAIATWVFFWKRRAVRSELT